MSTENLNQVNAADTETGSAEQAPRVVTVSKSSGVLDVTSLVLVAVLIAAGFILNLTVGTLHSIGIMTSVMRLSSHSQALRARHTGTTRVMCIGGLLHLRLMTG